MLLHEPILEVLNQPLSVVYKPTPWATLKLLLGNQKNNFCYFKPRVGHTPTTS